ncbi:hypothetical protein GobsT_37080 [Gemmata obscuriglobus]|uniref:Uncharacterized protein n=1 Tax=Gemmata obscuriglobus TaxID=114 RepID=A0A2Z3H006_9BACT|nr:hypothetical protein [Gemmata obscuriglobus]AWM38181.1 hypothetical protein C1280_15110 [Gemmata obscuriglobus]QEG28919.1 hypothetical protein GobsT_37080 [Gemmata obscuriglobus]VTS07412.1 unnamed protein product [Gemmata obscuriglobus UQM 2246]
MSLNDLIAALGLVLPTINCNQPRAAVLRDVRAGLDAALPNWREVAAADGRMQHFRATVQAPHGGPVHVGLILWSRTETGDE